VLAADVEEEIVDATDLAVNDEAETHPEVS
jgi:hypothetical protein